MSVVIPTHNRAALLPRAIASVLAQTVQDFEVIVVDDGSSDDTEAVVGACADARIAYVRTPRRRGPSAARNVGIRMARGAYIAFLDSDDCWTPHKLERQLDVFRTSELPTLGIVMCGIVFMESATLTWDVLPAERGWIYEELLSGRAFRWVTYLVKRDAWDGLFDETLRAQEDWDYLLRASQACQIDYVAEPLVIVDRTPHERVHGSVRARIDGYARLLELHREEFARHPRLLSTHYQAIAQWCVRDRAMASVRSYMARAVRLDPWNWRLYAWLVSSWLGSLAFRAAVKFLAMDA